MRLANQYARVVCCENPCFYAREHLRIAVYSLCRTVPKQHTSHEAYSYDSFVANVCDSALIVKMGIKAS